jgi:SNF2 family DNA or RNA helicase
VEIKDVGLFERYKENLYTVGLEGLLLSKGQFIFDMPAETREDLKQKGQEYRILQYPYFAKDRIIVGMEEKDIKDVAAIFLDHEIGKGGGKIDAQMTRKAFEKDNKLALSVGLNIKNLVEHQDVLAKWLSRSEISTVTGRIEALFKELPKVDKKWDKPWWDTEVETPVIE